MKLLPKWILTNGLPAFHDGESSTAVEQTYKLYKAMNELIEEYNNFAESVNTQITNFVNDYNTDIETFTTSLRQEFQEFIEVVDLKIQEGYNGINEYIEEQVSGMAGEITNESMEYVKAQLPSEVAKEVQSLKAELESYIDEVLGVVLEAEY